MPPTIVGAPTLHPKVLTPGSTEPTTVVNLASANFSGLAGNEHIKSKAIECLRGYGVGSCGPPGFYGTFDVHIQLERSLAQFLGVEAAIIYSHSFSTVSSVIPAFAKRGDIIVADRGCNFAIQKGIMISRSTVYWYDHNDMDDLERVLRRVQSDHRRKPLTRRFIVSEALFEMDGQVVDLHRLLELKQAFKFRLILDETWSFGVLGEAGRGITEAFDVPGTDVDIILGSMATGLCGSGGFCAGSFEICEHQVSQFFCHSDVEFNSRRSSGTQRINSPAFVFSAALPPLLAVSATEALHYLVTPTKASPNDPPRLPLASLSDNVQVIRSILDKIPQLDIPSDPLSPVIHLHLTPSALKGSLKHSREEYEKLLQEIVDEALHNGVLLTRAMKVWSQEMLTRTPNADSLLRPSIRICVSAGLSKKECEKSANIVKNAVQKVLSKRR